MHFLFSIFSERILFNNLLISQKKTKNFTTSCTCSIICSMKDSFPKQAMNLKGKNVVRYIYIYIIFGGSGRGKLIGTKFNLVLLIFLLFCHLLKEIDVGSEIAGGDILQIFDLSCIEIRWKNTDKN